MTKPTKKSTATWMLKYFQISKMLRDILLTGNIGRPITPQRNDGGCPHSKARPNTAHIPLFPGFAHPIPKLI